MVVLPMFPLGTVLLPGMVLPLHLFEPRYRRLIEDVLGGDREFGVTLIERGSEVGGGDVRTGIGTVARVEEATELPDGRWSIVTVGTRRIVVEEWLPDDPYPRAEVRALPDPEPATHELASRNDVVAALRGVLAKAAELGGPAPPATAMLLDAALADDDVAASYQMAALTPVGPMDRQRLLAARTVGERLALLEVLLADADQLLSAQLQDPPPTGGDR